MHSNAELSAQVFALNHLPTRRNAHRTKAPNFCDSRHSATAGVAVNCHRKFSTGMMFDSANLMDRDTAEE